jgi:succinate dehydrogenase flavin-adding protein (antitoxin of CptAB toxin-antitoxin module)
MKELDLLLQDWLSSSYPLASQAEKALFEAFLELPDPEIARYLLGHEPSADPTYSTLVAQLVRSAP